MINFTDKMADIIVGRIQKNKSTDKKEKPLTKEEKKLLKLKEKEDNKKIGEFIYEWRRLMSHLQLENRLDQTFHMGDIQIKNYGFKSNIYSPVGLSLKQLESDDTKSAIESHFKCMFVIKMKLGYVEAQIITIEIPEIDYEYNEETKVNPWELYLATNIEGNCVKADMIKFPHLVVQGATNMGKTKMIDCLIVTLIKSCTPQQVGLYFLQADKPDQIVYRKCKHTRAYAKTLEEILATTNYILEMIESREKIFEPLIEEGIAENIYNYNKLKQNKNNQLSYNYVIIDEYSTLMPSDGEDPYKKMLKNCIQANMERIIQVGRYVGFYVVIGLQRSTIDKLPSFIKSMCNTIATFRVNNEKSSFVAIDSNEACGLSPREAIIKTVDKQICKTVTLSQFDIVENIKPYKWSGANYKNFVFSSWIDTEELKKRAYGKKYKPDQAKKKDNKNIEAPNNNNNTQKATFVGESKIVKDDKKPQEIKKNKIEPKKEEIVKVIDKIIETEIPLISQKAKSPYFIPDWKDISEKCTVVDKTRLNNSEFEKPKKKGGTKI